MSNWKRAKTDAAFRERMAKRSAILAAIRAFFRSRGFLEVETPTLVAHPGMEPHLEPFATEVIDERGRRHGASLITSPEYAMKKLLAAGYERIFEITRCYRNGEPFTPEAGQVRHNPEFTMIEWYRTDADYRAVMADTEELVASCADAVGYGGPIDLSVPWPRITVAEAFERHAGIDLGRGIDDPEWFRRAASDKGAAVAASDSFDDVFFKIFLRDVEPKLGADRPVILYEYPRSMAALARIRKDDPRYAERFEAYCGGLELCNAFSELNDAGEQRRRLEEEQALRQALGKPRIGIDEQFLEAVGRMPESAGIALGVDRLVMLLTNSRDIRDVLFFPASDIFNR
jgi:lysyl-tRNA synthetase class 2